MKKVFVNIPKQGIMSDLDRSEIHQDRCYVSENVRFYDDNGDFIAHPFYGNRQAYTLSEGFQYCGEISKGEISFIFSRNSSGLYEVGSYPSPKQLTGFNDRGDAIIDTSLSGFENVYKPLCNFTGKRRLRTNLFEFDSIKLVQGLARVIYDDTYNLYYTDRKNPVRLINSGFDTDGNIVDNHDITNEYFVSQINLIQNVARLTTPASATIEKGGELDYATYFAYVRYATSNLDVSAIVKQFGPLRINKAENYVDKFAGGNTELTNEKSDKRIKIILEDIDTSYEYVEVILSKYYSDENGITQVRTGLVNKKYEATDGVQMLIYGNEEMITVLDEDVTNEIPVDDKADYIAEFNNRMWGVNWVRQNKHSSVVQAFAALVEPEPVLNTIYDSGNTYYKRNDPNTPVYYFPEEVYPFAIKAILHSGTITYPYPITGRDFFKDPTGTTLANDNGLVRFPALTSNADYSEYEYKVYAIKFKLLQAFQGLTQEQKTWMYQNVKDFVIVQGDRIKNRVAMGISLPIVGNEDLYFLDGKHAISNRVSIPMYQHTLIGGQKSSTGMPAQFYQYHKADDGRIIKYQSQFYAESMDNTDYEKQFMALYSPDIMFNKTNDISQVGYVKWWVVDPSHSHQTTKTRPSLIQVNMKKPGLDIMSDADIDDYEMVGDIVNNNPANPSQKYRCINQAFDAYTDPNPESDVGEKAFSIYYFNEASSQNGETVSYSWSNRNLVTPKYLLLKSSSFKTVSGPRPPAIMVAYKKNPNDITVADLAQSENTIYYEKSILALTDITDTKEVAKGDMYFGLFNFKQMSWDPSSSLIWNTAKEANESVGVDIAFMDSAGDDQWLGTGKYYTYAHGLQIFFPGFFEDNIGYRTEDVAKSFYPSALGTLSHEEWIKGPRSTFYTRMGIRRDGTTLESFAFNKAYNQMNSIRGVYGHDKINIYDKKIIKAKTRMRYSVESSSGEVRDSWRLFAPSAYKDYDQRNGEFVGVAAVYGYLISIQESAINRHYVNEKEVKIPSTSGELVIGRGSVLSDKVNVLSEYGAQSNRAFASLYEMIIGYDNLRNIAWVTTVKTTNTRVTVNAIDITEGGLVSNLFEKNIQGGDVYVSVNKISKEVWFSSENNDKVVIYDYKRNIISTVRTAAYMGAHLTDNGFFTSRDGNKFYIEHQDNIMNYYGKDHTFKLGIIANGMSAEGNMTLIDKFFESLDIVSSYTHFSRILFQTEGQHTNLVPFYKEQRFWNNPERDGAKWTMAIPQQTTNEKFFDEKKEMEGTWLYIQLEADNAADFYVRSFETKYKIK